ncbi:uncharacterized protein BJ171DRAFT_491264, partial [Polychytrium aggregatum]|uniref:uncharacterized protein n=1 Tax=Polychytrium aggregatum TaxID=110093 RepID=UPI0022FE42A8
QTGGTGATRSVGDTISYTIFVLLTGSVKVFKTITTLQRGATVTLANSHPQANMPRIREDTTVYITTLNSGDVFPHADPDMPQPAAASYILASGPSAECLQIDLARIRESPLELKTRLSEYFKIFSSQVSNIEQKLCSKKTWDVYKRHIIQEVLQTPDKSVEQRRSPRLPSIDRQSPERREKMENVQERGQESTTRVTLGVLNLSPRPPRQGNPGRSDAGQRRYRSQTEPPKLI